MENGLFVYDRLKEMSRELKGVSQLLLHAFEDMRNMGLDAEYLLILNNAVRSYSNELSEIADKLYTE